MFQKTRLHLRKLTQPSSQHQFYLLWKLFMFCSVVRNPAMSRSPKHISINSRGQSHYRLHHACSSSWCLYLTRIQATESRATQHLVHVWFAWWKLPLACDRCSVSTGELTDGNWWEAWEAPLSAVHHLCNSSEIWPMLAAWVRAEQKADTSPRHKAFIYLWCTPKNHGN